VCAPDNGWRYHPKHVEQFPDINKLCNVSSCWAYIGIRETLLPYEELEEKIVVGLITVTAVMQDKEQRGETARINLSIEGRSIEGLWLRSHCTCAHWTDSR